MPKIQCNRLYADGHVNPDVVLKTQVKQLLIDAKVYFSKVSVQIFHLAPHHENMWCRRYGSMHNYLYYQLSVRFGRENHAQVLTREEVGLDINLVLKLHVKTIPSLS